MKTVFKAIRYSADRPATDADLVGAAYARELAYGVASGAVVAGQPVVGAAAADLSKLTPTVSSVGDADLDALFIGMPLRAAADGEEVEIVLSGVVSADTSSVGADGDAVTWKEDTGVWAFRTAAAGDVVVGYCLGAPGASGSLRLV